MIFDTTFQQIVRFNQSFFQLFCSLADNHDFEFEVAIIELGGEDSFPLPIECQNLKYAIAFGFSCHEINEESMSKGGWTFIVLLLANSQFHYIKRINGSLHFRSIIIY